MKTILNALEPGHKHPAPPGDDFARHIDLKAIATVTCGSYPVSMYVLGNKGRDNNLQFVFGWQTPGFHSELDEAAAKTVINHLADGFGMLPLGELLTIDQAVFADDRPRQAQLDRLIQSTGDAILRAEQWSQKARIQQLTRQSRRQRRDITVYATWTPAITGNASYSHLEKFLLPLDRAIKQWNGSTAEAQEQDLQALLRQAAIEGHATWQNIFERMHLPVTPLDGPGLWQTVCHRFDRGAAPSLPQHLILDNTGLREEMHSEWHPGLVLTQVGLPQAAEDHIRINDRHIGVLTMMDKPDGWASDCDEVRAMFSVLNRAEAVNTNIVVQLAAADRHLQRTALQVANRQANATAARAADLHATDVQAQFNAGQAEDARLQLIKGETPVYVAVAAVVTSESRQALDTTCNKLISSFPGSSWVERERHLAAETWLQTLPVTRQPLQKYALFDQRGVYLSREVPGLMPLVRPKSIDEDGFELVTEEGGMPVHLDFYHRHPTLSTRNTAIFGATRSGKSVMAGGIVLNGLAQGLPVIAIDYPKADGVSTFTDFTRLLGGAYLNVRSETNNMFELPDIWSFPEKEQRERLDDFKGVLQPGLLLLITGDGNDVSIAIATLKAVLKVALHAFFNDACIMARYRDASQSGLGSPAWMKTPTLVDFVHFISTETLFRQELGASCNAAIDYICLQLRGWINSPGVGASISKPSSIRADAQLTVFALTNVSDPVEAAVMGMSAYLMALRRALSAPASIFFIDESPILMKFDPISLMIGRILANGAKAGIRTILSAQDPDTIADSKAGPQILQNINTILLGRTQTAAVDSFVRIFNYLPEQIHQIASEAFLPSPQNLYSKWLLATEGTLTPCRFYPSHLLLALTANNPAEQRARTLVMRHFSGRPVEGLATFARLLVQATQSGDNLEQIVIRWQRTAS